MKFLKIPVVLIIVLMLTAVAGVSAFAADYKVDESGNPVSGIRPEDTLTLPENTDWATLTAEWGVRITFRDGDTVLYTEVVPESEGTCTAPKAPEKEGFVFKGWKRSDSSAGEAVVGSDGKVTGIKGPGEIILVAEYQKGSANSVNSKTGDSGNPAVWGIVLAAAAAGVIIAVCVRKKRSDR